MARATKAATVASDACQHSEHIATMEIVPWQDEFRPVLQTVCDRLLRESGSLLHSLYVYGSVAAAKAIPGKSDLDLCLILLAAPSDIELAKLDQIRLEIAAAYPVVRKIDFDIGTLANLAAPETSMAWQYWIKHHCRCVAGNDLADEILPFMPSRALALAINGDFERVLGNYLEALAEASSAVARQRLIQEASRKLIRSTNILRRENNAHWPYSLEDYAEHFRRLYPAQAREIEYFLRQATQPDGDAAEFRQRMRQQVKWMKGVLQSDGF